MKKCVGMLCIALLIASVSVSAQEKVLNLYGSAEPRSVEVLAEGFEKATGVKVNWIRMSSGETLARLRAEKDNPQGDVWWGGTTDPHSVAALEGLTEAYCPSIYDELDPRFRDPLGDCQVIGVYVGVLGFSANEGVLKEMGLPTPTGWEDLIDPKYKGLLGVANPNTSGTALTTLATQIFRKGEEEGKKVDEDAGIDYMKALHANIANYTKSGVAPGILAGRGELGVAIVFLHDVIYQIEEGYPVTAIAPVEGTGYEIGGLNMIKNAPHPELAKQFMDWVVSAEAQETQAKIGAYQLPTNTKAKVPDVAIPIDSVKTVNYDFQWVAENGVRITDRWTREVFTLPR
ncbi:iron ABC transporter substrate-binding protein [candidate division KSB3 bacterium]|uniref:Iron ABC transporter substrate-binding protein n=1 Tax=candidate division KSB3 bacterium TaxID=2044937 RepID=A0A2G6KBX5_9BACT|nr:MAG: iron ABC transporter substrate-binding protein [candidate division KSB3 bacterium]